MSGKILGEMIQKKFGIVPFHEMVQTFSLGRAMATTQDTKLFTCHNFLRVGVFIGAPCTDDPRISKIKNEASVICQKLQLLKWPLEVGSKNESVSIDHRQGQFTAIFLQASFSIRHTFVIAIYSIIPQQSYLG